MKAKISHDWICAPEFSELIAREIPGADLHIIGNSGHSVLADQGDLVLGLICNFLCREIQPGL